MRAAAVRFRNSERTYDYLAPFDVAPGDIVVVRTSRGEADVEVVEVKDHSERATSEIIRKADAGRRHPF